MALSAFPSGPIGFRLANELHGLLQGVSADHTIVAAETDRIRRWLAEAAPYRHLVPFSEVARKLDRALADGVLALEECEDLTFVIEKLTTVNPYFDAMRSGVQQLLGWLSGVAADQKIVPDEVERLVTWCDEWAHLKGIWPYDECQSLVTAMVAQGRWGDHAEHLIALAHQFPVAGHVATDTGELPPLLVGGVCAVDPDVVFDGRRFVFTGESSKCARATMMDVVAERGGVPWDNITRETNYLVVCDEGNPHWAFACYGRKVELACHLRREGHPVVIVHEVDFWDAAGGALVG